MKLISEVFGRTKPESSEEKSLKNVKYYVGWIPREHAEKLIRNDGEFLVRQTHSENQSSDFILSVRHRGRCHHYIIYNKQGRYYITDLFAPDIHDLVQAYVYSQRPVDREGAILKRPLLKPYYFFTKNQVEMKRMIGEGAFGKVYLGSLRSEDKTRECAIKMDMSKSKDHVSRKRDQAIFFKEAEIMLELSHPNILDAYGILVDRDPIKLILEYAPGGSLRTFLRKSSPSTASAEMLGRFCDDAANGLKYLASKKVIHCDVAARNCLIGYHNQLKISDFGLSQRGSSYKMDQLLHVPLKWLAPEVYIRREFSSKSDVWAYGILLWEIFTRCISEPYPNLNAEEAQLKILSGKQPMEAPREMPPVYANIMIRCFESNPSLRIDFNGICKLCGPGTSTQNAWI